MMKYRRFKNVVTAFIALFVLFAAFTACENISPLSEESSSAQLENMHIIDLGEAFATLYKGALADSAVITPEDGGRLILIYGDAFEEQKEQLSEDGEIKIIEEDSLNILGFGEDAGFIVSLDVLPYSVTDTTVISVNMDKHCFDMDFGPDGTVFGNPALLNIIAVNLNLNKIDLKTLGIYYDNPETGQWKKMESESVLVKEEKGFIRLRNAQIPHFSRYALAWSN